jgi:hypothetical protein
MIHVFRSLNCHFPFGDCTMWGYHASHYARNPTRTTAAEPPNRMKRPIGITISGVIAIVGSAFSVLLGLLMVMSSIMTRNTPMPPATPGQPAEFARRFHECVLPDRQHVWIVKHGPGALVPYHPPAEIY